MVEDEFTMDMRESTARASGRAQSEPGRERKEGKRMREEKKKEGASRPRAPSQERANRPHVPNGRFIRKLRA